MAPCWPTWRRGSTPSATRFNYPTKARERDELTARMNEADFWNDPKRAQAVIAELKVKRAQIEPLEEGSTRQEHKTFHYDRMHPPMCLALCNLRCILRYSAMH